MRETVLDPSASPLEAFGAQLRKARKAAGLTQAELGRLTSLSDSQISNLERVRAVPHSTGWWWLTGFWTPVGLWS
ncbi:helix-turn-helix transcriptional regulator [Kitasatospora sp. NPDC005856]|uniref:helix-turn-helix domain-containing protein n=1 Tax=Kitasatospora sp. NPDC005856 TaxID=3154566 RepID=UPI0033E0CCD7